VHTKQSILIGIIAFFYSLLEGLAWYSNPSTLQSDLILL